MPILEYRAQEFETTHERQIIEEFVTKLKQEYLNKDETVIVLENYICSANQIDATILKKDGIIVLEFKNYGGEILFSENGEWTANDEVIKGGRDGRNPCQQVRAYKYSLMNFLKDHAETILTQSREIEWGHVSGMVIFHQAIQFDKGTVPQPMRPWFHVTDISGAISEIKTITSSKLFLSDEELRRIPILLGLKEISEEASNNSHAEEISGKYRSYLESTMHTWEVKDYVHRPDIEKYILEDTHSILIGAPGSGKSSLLKEMLRHQAKQLLTTQTLTYYPVFLNLAGNEDIIERISGEIGITDLETTKSWLSDGKFWIVFDGIDESVCFKGYVERITTFVKQYRSNKYSLSIRRAMFDHADYQHLFTSLKDFEQRTIDQFSPEDRATYLRYRLQEKYSTERAKSFEEFISHLPDSNPLTIQMALEIYENSDQLIYENQGKFYKEYFRIRLKRESTFSKELRPGADILFHSILQSIGRSSTENGQNLFPIPDILSIIQEETSADPLKYYDLLIRSEILVTVPVIVTTGQHKENDVWVKFYHQTYRDYYSAQSLAGTLTDEESIQTLIEKTSEHNTIVLLCGIETQISIVDALILTAISNNLSDLAVECFCNTSNISARARNGLENYLKEMIDDGNIGSSFHYLNKYKARIALLLLKLTDAQLESNLFRRIDWEYEKFKVLGISPDKKFSETLRFKRLLDANMNSPFSELANIFECQNAKGVMLYNSLTKDNSSKNIFRIIKSGIYPQAINKVLENHLFTFGIHNTKEDDKEIIKYLDEISTRNILRSIQWHFYKSCRLGYPMPPYSIIATPLHEYLINNPERVGLPASGGIWNCEECQTELGYTFYLKLTDAKTEKELFDLLTDSTYPLDCRAFVLQRFDREYANIYEDILLRLKDNGMLLRGESELFWWMTLQIVFSSMTEVYDDINTDSYPVFLKNIQNQLIEVFWSSSLHLINLRIAFNILTLGEAEISLEFARTLLRDYEDLRLVDVRRIKHLTDLDHIYNEFSFANDCELVMDYSLDDFQNETCSTLIKCFALERIDKSDSFEDAILLQKFVKSENPKLQRLAKYYLKNKRG